MSGYTGYREIGRFLKENQWEFKKYLTFCKVPTYGSIRRIFMEIDFDDFALKSENETIDITVKWVLIVLVVIFAFLEILERRNIIYDNNNYKRMETLCERLLEE